MKPVIAFRELLGIKSPDNRNIFQYIMIEPPRNILCNFTMDTDISKLKDEQLQEVCQMISFKFYHHTRQEPAELFFKLEPGNYDDDVELVKNEFLIKYKEWLAKNKLNVIETDFK